MIEFESVSKTFRDGTDAVVDLSITIPTGQITVIVGPSGCGKTTTLRMVNRMLEPTSGRITWDGNPLKSKRKTALRRQMGYVIQSGGLFPHRTVLDNIGTVPGLLGWSKDKTHKRSLELLNSVGLDPKARAPLSGAVVRRSTAARRCRPGAGRRPARVVDGRAVLRGRPGRPQRTARVLPGSATADQQDDHPDHPRHRRSHQARRSGGDHARRWQTGAGRYAAAGAERTRTTPLSKASSVATAGIAHCHSCRPTDSSSAV